MFVKRDGVLSAPLTGYIRRFPGFYPLAQIHHCPFYTLYAAVLLLIGLRQQRDGLPVR
jgi:hypothetical protein